MGGPLSGFRVVEMAGIGPVPFCGMLLADMGADVVRVDRPAAQRTALDGTPIEANARRFDVTGRGKRVLSLDLKEAADIGALKKVVRHADILIEGFRPGVMERLGIGPEVCLDLNPRLVYGRMTGWGQFGPLSGAAGHDINYLSITGLLAAMGRADSPPAPPLNLVADYGGGAMMLAFGVVCAVLHAARSGEGQVVDAAMCDGAALLGAMIFGMHAEGSWMLQRASNLLDGAAHFYDTYECADGKFISVGAIEPKFYQRMISLMGLDASEFSMQHQKESWESLKQRLSAEFRKRPRDEWTEILEGSDACFAPVLDLDEAPNHPHNAARGVFVSIDGVMQPAPAPRFSATSPLLPTSMSDVECSAAEVVAGWERSGSPPSLA